MTKRKRFFVQLSLTLIFTIFVFLTMSVSMLAVYGGMRLLSYFNIISYPDAARIPLLLFALISLIVGFFVSLFVSRRPMKPWYILTDAANRIAEGDYDVRVRIHGPETVENLFDSFNHMAEELGSVEMLRSDFVNNFSHEFKTPIVSIRGFAKMLKKEGLTAEEREEYLDIIISESERLADLAENVLNLSRVEQQTILTEKTRFNLTEQIRLVVALMMSKWAEKDADISLSGEEVYITGNQEMMRQIWINLLDNALKFSTDPVIITIRIEKKNAVSVAITDNGIGMSEETAKHIFEKFYQGDSSRDTKGNGLGLPLARRIAELHGGTLTAVSEEGKGTVMTVALPSEDV